MAGKRKYMVSDTSLLCSITALLCCLCGVLLMGLSSSAIAGFTGSWGEIIGRLLAGDPVALLLGAGLACFLLAFILIGVGVAVDKRYLKKRIERDALELWQQGK